MALGGSLAGVARVVLRVDDGQFNRDLARDRTLFSTSTAAMGRDAGLFAEKQVAASVKQRASLRSVAVELQRVARSDVRTTEERVAAAKLLERTQRELGITTARSSEQATAGLLAEERALGRFSRGALAAVGISSELKRALLLGSGSFLVGAGLGEIVKSSIDAAKEQEVALGQLQNALHNTGNDWGRYRGRIEEALQAQVKATGFTDNELTASLAGFVRRFGDVNQALRANAIAADVARAKNISLADAQTLIMRASFGNPRSLRILGIELNKTTANYDALKASTKHASAEQVAAAKAADLQANELSALDQVQARYHGNAARFLTTTAGRQALFNAELDRSKEIIGTALLPTFNHYLDRMSTWLDRANRTGKLQRDVNRAVHDAGVVFHDVGDVIHNVETFVGPLNRLLGGTRHTVGLLVGALVAFKVRGALAFMQGAKEIGGAATIAAGEVDALTLAEGRAAGAAGAVGAGGFAGGFGARPVFNPGATGVAGRVGAYTGAPAAGPARIGYAPGGVIGGAASIFVIGSQGESTGSRTVNGQILGENVTAIVAAMPDGGAFVTYTDPVQGGRHTMTLGKGANLGKAIAADLTARYPFLSGRRIRGTAPRRGVDIPSRFSPDVKPLPAGAAAGHRRGSVILGLTERQNTALLIAQGTAGTSDDLRELRKQLAELDRLTKQKGLKPGDLNSILSQRNSVADQIDSIVQQNAQQDAERSRKAKAKLEAAARKRKDAKRAHVKAILDAIGHNESGLKDAVEKAKLTSPVTDDVKAMRALEAFYHREATDSRLSRAARDAFKAKDLREKVAIKGLLKGAKSTGGANEREFLQEFQSVIGDFASNFGANAVTKAGAGGTTVHVHQNFNAPTDDRHREARYTRIAMQAAFDS